MIDTDAVKREIEAGRAELAASDKAILTLATRRRIWKAMLDPQDNEETTGLRRCSPWLRNSLTSKWTQTGRKGLQIVFSFTYSMKWMILMTYISPRSSLLTQPPIWLFQPVVATLTTIPRVARRMMMNCFRMPLRPVTAARVLLLVR